MPFENVASYAQRFREEAQRRSNSNQTYEESFRQDLNYRQQEAKSAGQDWEALAKLTEAGQEYIKVRGQEQAKESRATGAAKAREEIEVNQKNLDDLSVQIEALRKADKEDKEVQAKLKALEAKHGELALVPISETLNSLNRNERIGYHSFRMKYMANNVLPGELSRRLQLAREEDPDSSQWSVPKTNSVIQGIYNDFVVENFPTETKESLLLREEHFYKYADAIVGQLKQSQQDAILIAQGEEIRRGAKLTYATDPVKGFDKYLTAVQSSWHKSGRRTLTRIEALDQWEKDVVELYGLGLITAEDWGKFGEDIHPVTNKQWKENPRYIKLTNDMTKEKVRLGKLKIAERQLAGLNLENAIYDDLVNPDPNTPSKTFGLMPIESMKDNDWDGLLYRIRLTGHEPTKLETLRTKASKSAQAINKWDNLAEQRYLAGTLTTEWLEGLHVPLQVQERWKNRAVQQQAGHSLLVDGRKALEEEVRNTSKPGTESGLGVYGMLIHAELVGVMQSKFLEYIEGDAEKNIPPMSARAAATQAIIDARQHFIDNGGGSDALKNTKLSDKRYYFDNAWTNYAKYKADKVGGNFKKLKLKLAQVTAEITKEGSSLNKVWNEAGSVLDENQIKDGIKSLKNGTFEPTELVKNLAAIHGETVFEIYNKQIRAWNAKYGTKHEELKPDVLTLTPVGENIINLLKNLTEGNKRLLSSNPSSNVVARIFTTSDTWPLKTYIS